MDFLALKIRQGPNYGGVRLPNDKEARNSQFADDTIKFYKNYFYLLIVVFLCILLVHDLTRWLALIYLSCINEGCMYGCMYDTAIITNSTDSLNHTPRL